ncbi:response regulator [Winogradskyella sp. SYSU M77433]|uniref:response regulator n=1 Tax=Winogradskyella sp. SYSU M77433 TaxID=3042722 RepID=UPI00247FF786|nr:response regulator [Winogradskyella sp. SYSU M77433]MDH7913452.1 response regulator [Winogradskyella sp. SYSU M77433]
MKQKFSVLIVEDHQINIDSYKNALEFAGEKANVNFTVSEALNCDQAFERIASLKESGELDIVILDISLPPSKKYDILNGEGLGSLIKQKFPKCKLMVCTSLNDNFRLNSILKSLNPDAFLIKSDITFLDLVSAINKILKDGSFYSETILNLMRKKLTSDLVLDDLDVKILQEISNGARMKELTDIIPLSKTGIERRKKNLKNVFKVKNDSDRDLIIKAREKGFI